MNDADYSYWHAICDVRAQEGTEEDWVAGKTLISIETVGSLTEETLGSYAQNNFATFLRYLRFLTKEDQATMLAYILLGSSQSTIGALMGRTQTVCSFRVRMATKLLGFLMLCGGYPNEQQLRAYSVKAGLEPNLTEGVVQFVALGQFAAAADKAGMRRPELRRGIAHAARALLDGDNQDPDVVGLGAFLYSLTDSKDPTGTGKSKALLKRPTLLTRTDPECLGQFRMSIEDEGFGKMFASKSSFYEHDDEEGSISE